MNRCAAVLVLSAFAAGPALAGREVLTLDPRATTIAFHLDATGHNVEGKFELVAGEVRFDPESGAAEGEIRIDATKGESGNKKRDKTMHEKVLESGEYPLFLFRAERVEGTLSASGTSTLSLKGTVTVHGATHPLTLPVTVSVDGEHLSAKTTFPIPYVAWGMKDPSWFILRVAKEVEVTVQAEGTLAPEPVARASDAH